MVIITKAKRLPLDQFDLVVQLIDPTPARVMDEVIQDRLLPTLHKVRALDEGRRATLRRCGGTNGAGRWSASLVGCNTISS